jgi:hypothetical protein
MSTCRNFGEYSIPKRRSKKDRGSTDVSGDVHDNTVHKPQAYGSDAADGDGAMVDRLPAASMVGNLSIGLS